MTLRAPFPWFGGKRRVADVVWRAFGSDVANYVEPFAGSLAVLLGRPGGPGKIETVNDRDCYLANFWRAVTAAPDAVAAYTDWPVNEADLHARHRWLVSEIETHRARMHNDADYYDEKIAGWWVWGICQWIGGGWCVEPNNQKHPKLDGIGKGVHSDAAHPEQDGRRPHLSGEHTGMGVLNARASRRGTEADWNKRPELDGTSPGRGVHSDGAHLPQKMPFMGLNGTGSTEAGRGVLSESAVAAHRGRRAMKIPGGVNSDQRPHLDGASTGMGVHNALATKQQIPNLRVTDGASGSGVHASGWNARLYLDRRPDLSNAHGVHLPSLGNDRGLNGVAAAPCSEWFQALLDRLRRVRVACGDWRRVMGPSVLGKGKNVGGRRPCAVFLDPPYSHELRDAWLYAEDDAQIAVQVREWALEHGDDPDLRIALCGYVNEHDDVMPASWKRYRWKAARGYASEDNDNREQECIWFSPHCIDFEQQRSLFSAEVLG